MYNESMENAKLHYALSVRELVETALPQGDLVLMPSSGRRLQEGTRLHQQYQKNMDVPGYVSHILRDQRMGFSFGLMLQPEGTPGEFKEKYNDFTDQIDDQIDEINAFLNQT